jgi:drug/metabolite transporter (DMT)-like permease
MGKGSMPAGKVPVRAAMLVIVAGALWGTVAVIVKVLVESVDPTLIAFFRILLAGLSFTLILLLTGGVRLPRPDVRAAAIAGVGIAMNYYLFTLALRYTLASAAAMVVQSEIVFLAILSVLFMGESFGRRKALGMGMALSGVLLIIWNGEDPGILFASEYFLGNVIVFVAGFFWAIYVFFQKRMATGPDILASLSPVFLIAALFLLPVSFSSLGGLLRLSGMQLLTLLYLGIVCTGFGYMLLAEGMKKMSASAAGILTTVMPLTSVLLAVVFLREVLTSYIMVGALLDLTGVMIVIRAEGASPPQLENIPAG